MNLTASRRRQDVVFHEERAFSLRTPDKFLVDVTLTYRINKRSFSQVWALQVKNATSTKTEELAYNYKTESVGTIREGFPLPVLSYKIEF